LESKLKGNKMPKLQPQGTAGWTYYGAGGQYIKSMPVLPVQQEQDDVMGLLNQQHQQEIQQIDGLFTGQQESIMSDARYRLQTLSDKYQTERRYVEGLRIPADQKRQKLLQLNTKYELAAITAKSKIRPDIDTLNMQKNQMMQRLQAKLQDQQVRIGQIQKLVDKGIISPDAALQEQYEIAGYSLPVSAFRQPDPQQQLISLSMALGTLEEQAKTAKGEERKNILLQIERLEQERVDIMSKMIPGFKAPIRSATKLSRAALAAGAGRKPGTLAEGMLREKKKALTQANPFLRGVKGIPEAEKPKMIAGGVPGPGGAGWAVPANLLPERKKEPVNPFLQQPELTETKKGKQPTPIEPKYQRNKKTGEMRVSYDGGKTWQVIG